jgi:hypothetical protein
MNQFQLDAASRQQRRTAISSHETQIGLDFIQVVIRVAPERSQLFLHFIPALADVRKAAVPNPIQPENIRITASSGATPLDLNLSATQLPGTENKNILTIDLTSVFTRLMTTSHPIYTLELVNLLNVDRFFSRATFSLEANSISEFDSISSPLRSPTPPPELEIDYLARDYGSFRQLMFDRLSVLSPSWKEQHPADLSTVLVEVLAYAGDRLSYYQDAVATEAYLGTARRRISVKRHAQLIDYRMHEGCNARAWVQIQIRGKQASLFTGTVLATKTELAEPILSGSVYEALKPQLQVFETLHAIDLVQAINCLSMIGDLRNSICRKELPVRYC